MAEMKSYYVKVRPTVGGEWNIATAYDFWTTVFDPKTGDSYLSIRDAPAGVSILDTTYWTPYSRNDARYEYLLGLVKNISGTAATAEQLAAIEAQLTSLIAASGSTEGNTELHDIRNGADGMVYETAGLAVRKQLGNKINKDDAMSWSQWFDSHRTGWRGGVEFPQFSASQSTLGTKTGDNADVVVETSTNTKKGRNDFENQMVTNMLFNGIKVNGYIDTDGIPHITAIEGSSDFSLTGENGDVWRAFMTPFMRRIYTDEVEGWEISDHPVDGLKPFSKAVRPDGSYHSFYFMPVYPGVKDDDGKTASITNRPLMLNTSHNNQITEFKKKGDQYCGMTSDDVAWAQWMFDMKFANKNSQSIMQGTCSMNYQCAATVVETNTKRVIIGKSDAAKYMVGASVYVGYAGLSNGASNIDRGQANMKKYADNVRILAIEDYDDNNSAIYVDAPAEFSTEPVALNDTVTSPVYISTAPWWSGACDQVLGVDGSPTDPKSGKEPFVLSGVEFGHGAYTVISDVILNGVYDEETDTYSQTPYIVDDNCKIATSITEDYTELAYSIPDTNNSWKYISKTGYDERYPYVALPVAVGASSSTGYGDGINTGTRATALREWLWFGSLVTGSLCGARYVYAFHALTSGGWNLARRLSYLRRGAAA